MAATEPHNRNQKFAEAVRAACIEAAVNGYENASISGLCAEGAFEAAISAIRMLNLRKLAESEEFEIR